MPTININVKVKAGKRTPAEVEAYYTAVNEKTITLVNGEEITAGQIAEWIATELCRVLQVAEGTLNRTAVLGELVEEWEAV